MERMKRFGVPYLLAEKPMSNEPFPAMDGTTVEIRVKEQRIYKKNKKRRNKKVTKDKKHEA